MGGGGGAVLVVAPGIVPLAVGLAGALHATGWATTLLDGLDRRPGDAGSSTVRVAVADGVRIGRAVRYLDPSVCVVPVRALPLLLPFAERGARVLDADAPFTLLVRLVDEALREERRPDPGALRRRAAEVEALERLTPQESQTLQALMLGETAAEIATRTSRSVHTVRSQIKAVLAKLGVRSQTAATAVAERSGVPLTVQLARAQFTNCGDEAR
ncbi:helix-turn-helix transcriptional regulator [Cellulomonas sp. URHD0024]|uniref:helix-turn-helix transcriptional regulator n=1 Tax=Cellulomonas sp. URHD0024 TaxID=1302620 RepID=UPI0012DE9BB2|nr:helix-turn-helix transcriptional regulator [Cellulomonas sp. URHD0024]